MTRVALAARDLHLRAGTGASARPLMQAFSAVFQPGRVTAIVGPNGAGKSTLLSVLAGLRAPAAGRIELGGRPLTLWRPDALARARAVMPQHHHLPFPFTVRELVAMGRYPHRHSSPGTCSRAVEEALAQTGLGALAARPVQTLSGGEQARAHLARALAQLGLTREAPSSELPSRWLLLDEPTAALDLQQQHRLLEQVHRWATHGGLGVLAVLHDLNLAQRFAHDTLVLSGRDCAALGPTAEVLQPERIAQIWGVQAQPVLAADGHRQWLFQLAGA